MRVFRCYFKIQVSHVHCRLFSTTSQELTGTCLGDFTIAKGDEFRDLLGAMSKVLFVAEDEGVTVFDACKND
jgi:hypothetical protein